MSELTDDPEEPEPALRTSPAHRGASADPRAAPGRSGVHDGPPVERVPPALEMAYATTVGRLGRLPWRIPDVDILDRDTEGFVRAPAPVTMRENPSPPRAEGGAGSSGAARQGRGWPRVPAGGGAEGRLGGVFVLDRRGTIRYCDRDLAILLGCEAAEICDRSLCEFLPELGVTTSGGPDLSALATPGAHRLSITPAWGQRRQVELRCHDLGEQGNGMVVMEVRDAPPSSCGEDWTKMLRRMYRASEAIMITDRNGVIEYVNPRYEAVSGFNAVEMLGRRTVFMARPDGEADSGVALLARLMTGERLSGVMVGFEVNGGTLCVEADVRPYVGAGGAVSHFVNTLRERGRSMRELEELTHAATHDHLTELPNRRLFLDRFQHALKGGSRHGMGCTLAFIDVDNLKTINDTHGHGAGDMALKAVARRITDSIREVDTVARLGGDEFGLILVDTADQAASAKVFDKILDSLVAPLATGYAKIHVSLSIGACFCPAQGGDPQAYLDQADEAMYSAKRAGGNRYHYYSQILPWRRKQAEGEAPHAFAKAPWEARS